jgi:hypothetical protein
MMSRLFCIGLLLIASSPATMPVFASESVLERDVSMGDTGSMAKNSGTWRHTDLPLAFEENRGQTESAAQFLAHGRGYQIHLAPEAVGIAVDDSSRGNSGRNVRLMRLRFLGARLDARAVGVKPTGYKTSYLVASGTAQQVTDVPSYSRIVFEEVYPGVSLAYYGTQRNLEYDVLVRAGSDPSVVRLAIDGADRIQLGPKGDLQLALGTGTIGLKRPVAYQEYAGRRHFVKARFERRGSHEVVIRTGQYNHRYALTIDPVLTYGTYLGGSNEDFGTSITVDASGNAYLTGYTSSTDFPVLSAYQTTLGRAGDVAFVTKMNASATGIVYSTYLGNTGGGSDTEGRGIAVDSSGNAYVTGTTTGGFPTTSGAYQTSCSASWCSFVAKLGSAGNTLVYGTYIQSALAASIAVNASGNAYVTGQALSTFLATAGAYQTADKATARLAASGSAIPAVPLLSSN